MVKRSSYYMRRKKQLLIITALTIITVYFSACTYRKSDEIFPPQPCDTTHFAFAANVQPIFKNNCTSCHNPTIANKGVDLSTYAGVIAADTARIRKAINWLPGVTQMPYLSLTKISSCEITIITKWMQAGAANN